MSQSETLALIALLQRDKSRWADIRVQLERISATDLLAEVAPVELLGDAFSDAMAEARAQFDAWTESGIGVLSVYDSEYPAQLRSVHDYPPMLFSRGSSSETDSRAIAVVGTRSPSEGAARFIRDLVPMLALDGHPVVSGLAKGVDTLAMNASLEAGNRTVGIIGTGIRKYYPPENRGLQDLIASEHLLLSQFWPDAPPTRQSFPMRNHVMSAFSSATIIVEAGENSGTRIQARAAVKHARPLIISRAVYVGTKWGRELVDRRLDVTVISNAAEALDAVRAIEARRSEPPVWMERALTKASA